MFIFTAFLKNALLCSSFKYILLIQKCANLRFFSVWWLLHRVIWSSRHLITLINPTAHLLYKYSSSCSLLHGETENPILFSYLYPCLSHITWSFPIFHSIFSRFFSSFYQFSFEFPSMIFIHISFSIFSNYLFLCDEYINPMKTFEIHQSTSENLWKAIQIMLLQLAGYLHEKLWAKKDRYMDPYNPLSDLCEVLCRVLGERVHKYNYHCARGMITM